MSRALAAAVALALAMWLESTRFALAEDATNFIADADPPVAASPGNFPALPEGHGMPPVSEDYANDQAWPLEKYADESFDHAPFGEEPCETPDPFLERLKWLGFRHSSRDGRYSGYGHPLHGTSWRNRPYYFGADLGAMWMTRSVHEDVSRDSDVFGGIFGGWDWDHYWGTELGVHRATPELINHQAPGALRNDRLMIWSAAMMYYPWGDSAVRPYWRCGIGMTEIDFPTDSGVRRDDALWTIPIGVGVKYPFRRWLAGRAEFADQWAIGEGDVHTQHNLTLTFGLEWRFGVHPRSYWPWNPSRYIW
jgi:hypothetical protein